MLGTPIGRLRIVSLLEGISFLLLVFVGMPLKYLAATPLPNKILGMSHGMLTIVFVGVLLSVWTDKKISSGLAIKTFLASLIPFGAFFIEMKLKALAEEPVPNSND